MSTLTPRTDEAVYVIRNYGAHPPVDWPMVKADFARELERELADQAARFHDEIVSRQGTVRANQELDLKELNHLRAELATERETSRLLRVAMDVREDGYTQLRRLMSVLERELAAERERLDYLSTRGFEHRHHETGDHLAYEWTISSTNELKDVSLREVIDAKMKEDAK